MKRGSPLLDPDEFDLTPPAAPAERFRLQVRIGSELGQECVEILFEVGDPHAESNLFPRCFAMPAELPGICVGGGGEPAPVAPVVGTDRRAARPDFIRADKAEVVFSRLREARLEVPVEPVGRGIAQFDVEFRSVSRT